MAVGALRFLDGLEQLRFEFGAVQLRIDFSVRLRLNPCLELGALSRRESEDRGPDLGEGRHGPESTVGLGYRKVRGLVEIRGWLVGGGDGLGAMQANRVLASNDRHGQCWGE